MVVDYINADQIIELFDMLLLINESVKQGKGYTDTDEDMRLTSKAESLLSQYSVTFTLSDLTLFDIDLINHIATEFYHKSSIPGKGLPYATYSVNPFASFIKIQEYPDIFNYITETNGNMATMKDDTLLTMENRDFIRSNNLFPLGSYKYQGIAVFSGTDILTLFNGFIENYLYGKIKTREALKDKAVVEKMMQDMYLAFTNTHLNLAYNNSVRKGLIEDYLNNEKYYAYTSKGSLAFKMAMINYKFGKIHFLGNTSNDLMNELSEYKNLHAVTKDSNLGEFYVKKDYEIYMSCCLPMKNFMELKAFAKHIDIVAHQSFDIPYSDETLKVDVDQNLQRYLTRINYMIQHNIDCKKIASEDKQLSASYLKYGLVLGAEPIKFIAKFSLGAIPWLIENTKSIEIDWVIELNKSIIQTDSFIKKFLTQSIDFFN